MGTWSKPLCTVAITKSGSIVENGSVKVDTLLIPSEALQKLRGHRTFARLDEKRNLLTFDEGIMSTCDSAKIYGYLTDEELDAWEKVMKSIIEQNSHINLLEAHFLCENGFPYFIRYSQNVMSIYVGATHHIIYTMNEMDIWT